MLWGAEFQFNFVLYSYLCRIFIVSRHLQVDLSTKEKIDRKQQKLEYFQPRPRQLTDWHYCVKLILACLEHERGCQVWVQNQVILAPNGTNLGLFKISFSTFWLGEPKCTETDLKKSQICLASKNVHKLISKGHRFVSFGPI